jgi:hypothetical protein
MSDVTEQRRRKRVEPRGIHVGEVADALKRALREVYHLPCNTKEDSRLSATVTVYLLVDQLLEELFSDIEEGLHQAGSRQHAVDLIDAAPDGVRSLIEEWMQEHVFHTGQKEQPRGNEPFTFPQFTTGKA